MLETISREFSCLCEPNSSIVLSVNCGPLSPDGLFIRLLLMGLEPFNTMGKIGNGVLYESCLNLIIKKIDKSIDFLRGGEKKLFLFSLGAL